MNTNSIPAAALVMAASIFPLAAQHPGRGPGHPRPMMVAPSVTPEPAPQEVLHPGDLSDLSALKDKFAAFQRLYLQGEAFFSTRDAGLQSRYAAVYVLIGAVTVGDRLEEPAARRQVDQLIAIGRRARELRGDAALLDDNDAFLIRSDLEKLDEAVKAASAKQAVAETLTPEVNRVQWTMDELVRYGKTGVLSEGRLATVTRKLEALETKEDEAKGDGKLSEHERQDLLDQTREVWRAVVHAFS